MSAHASARTADIPPGPTLRERSRSKSTRAGGSDLARASSSEVDQAAGLAPLLTYVALDIPWVDEAADDDVDGILFGALRVGSQLWGLGELSPNGELAASVWRARIATAAGRKVKRALEVAAQHIRPQADTSVWRQAMRVAGLRSHARWSSSPCPIPRSPCAGARELRSRAQPL